MGRIEIDCMRKIITIFLMTLCFWAIVFIGPVIVMLWNNLAYYLSGLGYGPDSFMYQLLTFVSQPISCFIAAAAANAIGKYKRYICVLVNCIVCACFCTLLATAGFLEKDFMNMASMIVSVVICIVACCLFIKASVEETVDGEQEAVE